MTCIDVHAHLYPSTYLDSIEFVSETHRTYARTTKAGDSSREIEQRLQLMNSVGVDLQILSVSSLFPYSEDQAVASQAARVANDAYAAVASRYRDRFAAFGVIPLPHVDESLAELGRCLDEMDMVGITIGTSVLGRPITDVAFDAVFAELDRREAVVFVHPSGVGANSPLIPVTGIGPIVEDTMAVMHLVDDGTISRYPHIRFLACHLGGAIPMVADRMNQHSSSFRPALAEPPSQTFRRLWYDTAVHGSMPALQCARTVYGADRLLLGTDFPYARGEAYRTSIDFIRAASLDVSDRRAILGENAQRLLRLGFARSDVQSDRG